MMSVEAAFGRHAKDCRVERPDLQLVWRADQTRRAFGASTDGPQGFRGGHKVSRSSPWPNRCWGICFGGRDDVVWSTCSAHALEELPDRRADVGIPQHRRCNLSVYGAIFGRSLRRTPLALPDLRLPSPTRHPPRPHDPSSWSRSWAPLDSSAPRWSLDRKSTRLNSSHSQISYAVFCLKKKKWVSIAPTGMSAQLDEWSARMA